MAASSDPLDHAMDSLYLLYHELHNEKSAYSYALDRESFRSHCELFSSVRKQPGMLEPHITFDDGHRSNYEIAGPVLAGYGLSAHFFITVGWTENKADFMDWAQVRSLQSSGNTIGAHGWSHKLLTHCLSKELDEELTRPRKTLEDRLGSSITTMSLPGGRHNQKVLQACWAAGYTEVFTSAPQRTPELRSLPATVGRVNVRNEMNLDFLRSLLTVNAGTLQRMQRNDRLKSTAKQIMGDRLYRACWALWNRHDDSDPAEVTAK